MSTSRAIYQKTDIFFKLEIQLPNLIPVRYFVQIYFAEQKHYVMLLNLGCL